MGHPRASWLAGCPSGSGLSQGWLAVPGLAGWLSQWRRAVPGLAGCPSGDGLSQGWLAASGGGGREHRWWDLPEERAVSPVPTLCFPQNSLLSLSLFPLLMGIPGRWRR